MNASAIGCAVSSAFALTLLLRGGAGDQRLAALFPSPRPTRSKQASPDVLRGGAVLLAACAVAVVVGGLSGVIAGALVAVALVRALAKLEPAASVRRRMLVAQELPIALDLLSACLLSGTTVSDAVCAVSLGLPGPVGDELATVHAALQVGVSPADAWLSLSDPTLISIGRSLARATTSGAPLAQVVAGFADERRAALHAEANAAARRAGVAAVAPLGLCFLPAFIGTAVVPVIAGLASHVLG